MNTMFLLMAKHEAVAIHLDVVAKDYFRMDPKHLLMAIKAGEVKLPVMRMSGSQKSPRMVHVADLAHYIDERRDMAKLQAGLPVELEPLPRRRRLGERMSDFT